MLDTVIANGRVVTAQGAGAWEIGIKGDQIVSVGQPGSLPTTIAYAARTSPAAGDGILVSDVAKRLIDQERAGSHYASLWSTQEQHSFKGFESLGLQRV